MALRGRQGHISQGSCTSGLGVTLRYQVEKVEAKAWDTVNLRSRKTDGGKARKERKFASKKSSEFERRRVGLE